MVGTLSLIVMCPYATLPSLLWGVLDQLELAYAREGGGRIGVPLDLWANLLRVVSKSGVACSDLPAALRLSRRAVRTLVSTAIRRGWIEERKLGRGRAEVRLTGRGSVVAARSKEMETSAEKAWYEQVGADRANRLRAALETIVAGLPLEHPHYPARYGAADASITGGNGIDWKAVPRTCAIVSGLSLSALVSQTLVAFAMGYERRSPVALSVSASVIRRIPVEGRSLKGLGHSVDVSSLLRHGFLRLDPGKGDTVWLTPMGLAVSSAHDGWIDSVELDWGQKYGSKSIAKLRSTLESVATKAVKTPRHPRA